MKNAENNNKKVLEAWGEHRERKVLCRICSIVHAREG